MNFGIFSFLLKNSQSYLLSEKSTKSHHPGLLARPCCSCALKYQCCGAKSGEEGCKRLHSCCDVRLFDAINNLHHAVDINIIYCL